MKIRMGPVLRYCGNTADRWKVSVLVVTVGEAGQLVYKVEQGPEAKAEPVPLTRHKGNVISRYDLALAQSDNTKGMNF